MTCYKSDCNPCVLRVVQTCNYNPIASRFHGCVLPPYQHDMPTEHLMQQIIPSHPLVINHDVVFVEVPSVAHHERDTKCNQCQPHGDQLHHRTITRQSSYNRKIRPF